MAWIRGLKTTYYLRALSATSTEKSTVDRGRLNAVSASATTSPGDNGVNSSDAADVPLACSIDDPDCEACQ
jgi:ribonucleoside-diphosphate reductase alpha chain